MAEDRIPVPKRDRPNRLEPAWHELADTVEGLRLKRRQDARSAAWRARRKAELAHPEEYEGVLLVGGRRYSVWGNIRAEPEGGKTSSPAVSPEPVAEDQAPRPKTEAERARDYRARRAQRRAEEGK